MGLGGGNTESKSENYGVGCGGAWPNPLGQPGLLRPLPRLGRGGGVLLVGPSPWKLVGA